MYKKSFTIGPIFYRDEIGPDQKQEAEIGVKYSLLLGNSLLTMYHPPTAKKHLKINRNRCMMYVFKPQ